MKMKMMGFAAALALLLQMTAVPVGAADGQIYEAEDAVMTGALETISESGASGGQVVGKFSESDDVLTFTVEIPSDGSYDLLFHSMGYGGDKTNKVSIDGEYIGTFVTKAEEYNDAVLSKVILKAGTHEVAITKSWGWIAVDYLEVQQSEPIPESAYQVSNVLSDPNATPETKALFTYLCEGYGKQVLSGQVADNGLNSDEFKSIYEVTGKKTAILGLDMMDYTPSRNAMGANVSSAVDGTVIDGAGPAEPIIYGDLDQDGQITAFDMALVKRGLLGEFASVRASASADVDRNGAVEVLDAVLIQKFLFGKIQSFTSET